MKSSHRYSDRDLKRIRLFGAVFIIIGLCFLVHSGMNLLEIHNRKMHMFYLDEGFTVEKGRVWSEFLAGMSVCLTGLLMGVKAGIDLKKEKKTE